MLYNPLYELQKANEVIVRHLTSDDSIDEISQDVLAQLRHLTEHLTVALVYGDKDFDNGYKTIQSVFNKRVGYKSYMQFLYEFHKLLQESVSHYVQTLDGSHRLFLKYREYLVQARAISKEKLKLDILSGLDAIKWENDPGLCKYYEKIYEKIRVYGLSSYSSNNSERFYIHSRKAVYAREKVFYEYSLVPATNFTSKFDHIIAFSLERIPTNYSVVLSIENDEISVFSKILPILVIVSWRTSIRPCEINKLLQILGSTEKVTGKLSSYKRLMSLLTATQKSLVDLSMLPDSEFTQLATQLSAACGNRGISELLVKSREILSKGAPGSNVLSYLLFRPRNKVIADQLSQKKNIKLSGMRLEYGCIPFDSQPYCTSLIKHSPSFWDLAGCISTESYEDNLLARSVRNKEEARGKIFISDKEFSSFGDLDNLIDKYNSGLYRKHLNRKLKHEHHQVFFASAEEDLVAIVNELTKLSNSGAVSRQVASSKKIDAVMQNLDDDKKKEIISQIFVNSDVALLYGSAGTGKTTLINSICSIFTGFHKVAIANTNPAVENLRLRINDDNCECMTITKYLRPSCLEDIDLLIIDECSTVSNEEYCQREILSCCCLSEITVKLKLFDLGTGLA